MTKEDIIRIASEAGLTPWTMHQYDKVSGRFIEADDGIDGDVASLLQFAALITAAEREECAKVAALWDDDVDTRLKPSEAIRARGD